ncbi:MAG: methionine synthase, partial [Gammaproteobacteria bacterium]|nr:methionine synthase [Gammaproteobacteria bacterium]
MSNLFEHMLGKKHTLLADGATGTNLFALGLQSGDAPELWNVE